MSERESEAVALMAHMKDVSSLYGQFRISTRGKLWNRLRYLVIRCEARARIAEQREAEMLEALGDLSEAARSACNAQQHPPLTEALFNADAVLAKHERT